MAITCFGRHLRLFGVKPQRFGDCTVLTIEACWRRNRSPKQWNELRTGTGGRPEKFVFFILILLLIYLLTAVGLTPGGSSTVHIYTQTVQQYSTHLHTDSTQYSSTVHIYTQTVHSTAVQYTFTHRQYTVQQYSTHLHTNSTQNNTVYVCGWNALWDSNPEWSN